MRDEQGLLPCQICGSVLITVLIALEYSPYINIDEILNEAKSVGADPNSRSAATAAMYPTRTDLAKSGIISPRMSLHVALHLHRRQDIDHPQVGQNRMTCRAGMTSAHSMVVEVYSRAQLHLTKITFRQVCAEFGNYAR